MKLLFESANSSVLLHGVLGKHFVCRRGVRQGDPLSPLLFVLAADLLQHVVNRAFRLNLIKAPLPIQDIDFPIVQYADDTLLLLQADARQLVCLKSLLHTFAKSTGLKINYSMSQMIPIRLCSVKPSPAGNAAQPTGDTQPGKNSTPIFFFS
jgi:hypothetical protein